MPNNLPLPAELQHLIEKRNGEERRGASGKTDNDSPPESREEKTSERRQANRRDEDQSA